MRSHVAFLPHRPVCTLIMAVGTRPANVRGNKKASTIAKQDAHRVYFLVAVRTQLGQYVAASLKDCPRAIVYALQVAQSESMRMWFAIAQSCTTDETRKQQTADVNHQA